VARTAESHRAEAGESAVPQRPHRTARAAASVRVRSPAGRVNELRAAGWYRRGSPRSSTSTRGRSMAPQGSPARYSARRCSQAGWTASSEDCACARRRSSTFHGGGESGNAPTGGDHLISDGSAPHFDRQGTGGRATRMRPPCVHQRYGEPGRAAHVEHEEPGVARSRRWPARPRPGGATCEPWAAPSTSRSADRRAAELEGRVVLTQHQTAVNNSGTPTCPGPETRRGWFNSTRCSRSWRRRAAIVIKRLNRVYPAQGRVGERGVPPVGGDEGPGRRSATRCPRCRRTLPPRGLSGPGPGARRDSRGRPPAAGCSRRRAGSEP
jgi:hypothetical protein